MAVVWNFAECVFRDDRGLLAPRGAGGTEVVSCSKEDVFVQGQTLMRLVGSSELIGQVNLRV